MTEPLSVECPKCHAKLKLKNRNAVGKKVACPKCSKPFLVQLPPADEDEFGFMFVPGGEAISEDPDEDDYGSDDDAPPPPSRNRPSTKKKKQAPPVNWQKPVAIGAGAMLLIGLLVGAGFLVQEYGHLLGGTNKIDMTYLPPEADLIVHARLGDVWNAPFVQSIVNTPAVKGNIDQLTQQFGINPADIMSITYAQTGFAEESKSNRDLRSRLMARRAAVKAKAAGGVVPASTSESVTVIRFKTAIDQEKLRKQTMFTEVAQHQAATYYRSANPALAVKGAAAYFADANTLLMGSENDLKAAIDRGATNTRRPDMDFIDTRHQVMMVMVPKDSAFFIPAPGSSFPGITPSPANATRSDLLGMSINISAGEGLELGITGNCATAEAGQKGIKELENAIGNAKAEFAKMKPAIPPQMADLANIAESVLATIKMNATGTTLEVTAVIPGSVKSAVEKLPLPLLAGMLPGMNPFGAMGVGNTPDGVKPWSTMGDKPAVAPGGSPPVSSEGAKPATDPKPAGTPPGG